MSKVRDKVIEAWDLGFCLGNVLKYLSRAEKKGSPVQDLEKALWYLQREINKRKGMKIHSLDQNLADSE